MGRTLKVVLIAFALAFGINQSASADSFLERLFKIEPIQKKKPMQKAVRKFTKLPVSVPLPEARPDVIQTLFPDLRPMPVLNQQAGRPVGHVNYCERYQTDCGPNAVVTNIPLNEKTFAKLNKVNRRVNNWVQPEDDNELYGEDELWEYPDNGYGDCEDYVLAKRGALMDQGMSASALLITVVRYTRPATGETPAEIIGHAVLTVVTDKGDLILDNLEPEILAWHRTVYEYRSRQDVANSKRWRPIDTSRSDLVAAIQAN